MTTPYTLEFDNPVYSDAGLTTEDAGPFGVFSSCNLPSNVYFSNIEYVMTGKGELGNILYTARFTYPTHVTDGMTGTPMGAVYDEV